jgi:hypothetical protein
MNKIEAIKFIIGQFQSSKNANTKSIVEGLGGVPICLVMAELNLSTDETFTEIKRLVEAKEIQCKHLLEPLNNEEAKRSFISNIVTLK